MRETFLSVLFAGVFGAAGFYCLTTTLDEMTYNDCVAGVSKACEAIGQPLYGPATADRDQ